MDSPAIVDSHAHLWNPSLMRYPWLDGLTALNRTFAANDYITAAGTANVSKVMVVECGCDPAQSREEVAWFSRLAETEPRITGIVAHAGLEKGDAVRPELEQLGQSSLVKGIRRLLQGETQPGFCLNANFLKGVSLLAEFDFTFDLCIRHEQLPDAIQLVRRVPQTQFILDHFGKPDVRSGAIEPWAKNLRTLACLPNVVCKVSGLTTEADLSNWRVRDLEFYFQHAVDCFGFDRLLFGSDWPMATLATSYPGWLDTVESLLASVDAVSRVKLFQTNAEKIYGI